MYIRHIHTAQQDSCGTVPSKSTLSKLNKCFYGAIGNYEATFNYFDLFGVL